MNQYLYDELTCASKSIKPKEKEIYKNAEVNVIADEHGFAAYLASFFVLDNQTDVNVILEGKSRNEEIYAQTKDEFFEKGERFNKTGNKFKLVETAEDYLKAEHITPVRYYYYFANLQLEEYSNPKFVEEKKNNLKKWLNIAADNIEKGGQSIFVFIPIFSFKRPFSNGISAISERELEAIALYEKDWTEGKLLLEMEDICRKNYNPKKGKIYEIRFDNIFGPLVKCTSKLGIDEIIETLAKENKIVIKTSDAVTYYTGCYIRQALEAVHAVIYGGANGNIYNAASYRFSIHDVKNLLYKSFISRNPQLCFENDITDGKVGQNYECLGNIKIENLKWKSDIPLLEAVYRTALPMIDDEYVGDFYVTTYQGKLERIKRLELDIMRDIDRVCKENGITYFLVGGTLLGAVRHHGFIPWDDDIDIGMLREDFDKFRKVYPKQLADNLFYQSYTNDPTSHFFYDKVRLKDTYFNTAFANRFKDIQNGIFIDVLVFDKTSNSHFGQKFHIKMIKVCRRLINVRWINAAIKGVHYRASKIFLPLMRKVPFKWYHRLFERAVQMFAHKKDSKYLIDSVGLNIEKGAFPIEWFSEYEEVPYEDMTFKIPKGYDGYLRKWYGDHYMELLPLSARNSGHKLKRLDLGKYLFEETEGQTAHENELLGELYEKSIY